MSAPRLDGVVLLAESSAMPPGADTDDLVAVIDAAVDGGVRTVIVRDKHRGDDERRALVAAVRRSFGSTTGTVLLARDEPGDALGADGVHLRARAVAMAVPSAKCLTPGVLGGSAHDVAEIERAADVGVDYVTVSPVFETPSKPGYGPALGVAGLAALVAVSPVPVVALGGVGTPAQVAACLDAGAVGVAVMGAVMRAADPAGVAAGLVAAASAFTVEEGVR